MNGVGFTCIFDTMKNFKTYSSIIFAFALLILMSLQTYFVYNSYRLEEKEINKKAKVLGDSINDFLDSYRTEQREEAYVDYFKNMSHQQSKQFEELNLIRKKIENQKAELSQKADSLTQIIHQKHGIDLALKNEIFSVWDEVNQKELLDQNPLITFSTKQKIEDGFEINNSKWESNQSTKEIDSTFVNNTNFNYTIYAKSELEVLNMSWLIIQKILPLALVSLLILMLIFYLYWKSEQYLKQQEKQNNQLHLTIDSIAHELNTPVTTLKFSSNQIQDVELRDLMFRQLNRIENSIQTIHNQTNESSSLITQKEIKNILESIHNQYNNVKWNIDFYFEKNRILKSNDFETILNNLVDNAVKYGAGNCDLNINFSNQILIEISDDGIGIPKNEISRIFDKYYRVDRKINQNINGLGVGLFLVNSIVKHYQGKIEVSNNRTKGVKFKIILLNEN